MLVEGPDVLRDVGEGGLDLRGKLFFRGRDFLSGYRERKSLEVGFVEFLRILPKRGVAPGFDVREDRPHQVLGVADIGFRAGKEAFLFLLGERFPNFDFQSPVLLGLAKGSTAAQLRSIRERPTGTEEPGRHTSCRIGP